MCVACRQSPSGPLVVWRHSQKRLRFKQVVLGGVLTNAPLGNFTSSHSTSCGLKEWHRTRCPELSAVARGRKDSSASLDANPPYITCCV